MGTALSSLALAALLQAAAPDFAREVQPILSDKCYLCHGPDESSRKARLRLDDEDAARARGVLGAELIERIFSGDELERMPPREAVALSAAEKDVLRRWIDAGAPYARHWAFEPLPASVTVPPAGAGWVLSDLDRFVARAHDRHGLEPAPPASFERWLRRVTFDLTGLPPTPEELAALPPKSSPDERARIVERLLESPAFGERMATPWLDVARYADSHGYQSDQLSVTWPYRDWVVRSIHANQPYDEFLTWQLAGDLVEEPTRDSRLATAFNRLHRMTNEGGSVEAEWRHAYAVDRVETLGTAVMGLTLACARCHDHKFDPVSQEEFYGLFAYFNSIDEWGMYHDSSRIPTPSLLLPDEAATKRLAELEESLHELESDRRFEATRAPLLARFDFDELSGENRLENLVDAAAPATSQAGNRIVEGRSGGALRFSGDDALQVADFGRRTTPLEDFSISFWLRIPSELEHGIILHRSSGTDVGYFGFDLAVFEGRLRARQVRFWPGNAAAIRTRELPRERWIHVSYTQHGTGLANDMHLYVDGAEQSEIVRDTLSKLPRAGGSGLELGARFRDFGLAGGDLDDLAIFGGALTAGAVRVLAEGGEIAVALPATAVAPAEFVAQRHEWLKLRTGQLEVSVMEETAVPHPAHVLARGEYDAPRTDENLVQRHTPAAVAPTDEPPRDRLALARWLTSDDHPLTARVAVNRIWQTLFGTGLVATASDFGLQGTPPSHPELLDWLARRFVDSGWDRKALVREIVLSATYLQDSAVPEEARAKDPENVWLARASARRLSAEMLRDAVLFASGLLDPRPGGPPVSPYQPPGLWRENNSMSPAYHQSVGGDLYRRSLYTVVKRTAPSPSMAVFDMPTREASCARRESTSTPMQGLVLLNDPQFVEAARVLAARALREAPEEPLRDVFVRLTGREPDEDERSSLTAFYRGELARAGAGEALHLSVGEAPVPEDVDRDRLAALTLVAQVVLASDTTAVLR